MHVLPHLTPVSADTGQPVTAETHVSNPLFANTLMRLRAVTYHTRHNKLCIALVIQISRFLLRNFISRLYALEDDGYVYIDKQLISILEIKFLIKFT